jgi:2-dehydropantoate 2-reductase
MLAPISWSWRARPLISKAALLAVAPIVREGMQSFLDRLKRVDVDARWSPHIAADMWAKFAFLATLAGITCLMRASIGSIVATEAGVPLILQLFEECRGVAAAEGYPLDPGSIENYRTLLTEPGSTFKSSMLRDIEDRRPIEADHILGDMLRRAQARDVATPLLQIAYTHTRAYEEQRKQVFVRPDRLAD